MVYKPDVSPNGQHTVAVFNSDDGPSVVVAPFGSTELTTIVKLKKSQDRVDDVYWLNNERILVSASYSERVAGNKYRISRLFVVNKDGSDLIEIKRNLKKDAPDWLKRNTPTVISILADDPKHILVQLYNREDQAPSVFKVNIYTNDFEKQFVNDINVFYWSTNKEGDVLFGYGNDEDDRSRETRTIWYRETVDADWKLLHKRKLFDKVSFNPLLVEEGKLYVLSDYQTGRRALWLYDIKSNSFEKLLFGHDKYDLSNVIFNSERTEIIGVSYLEHFRVDHFFGDKEKHVYQLVNNSFKGFKTSIAGWSEDRSKIIVRAQSHNSPSKYFWLDLQNKSGAFWFSQYPYLENKPLAQTQPFEFVASDGMKLNGYLTMPTNGGKAKPKLIIHPHGGPFGPRDTQYFNPYVQFMSNLGYAVLQVNFRGSGGFGLQYKTSGYREWGQRMQQDIYDAHQWLAQQGTVDTNDACVVGGSYGGFVALTAAIQKPNDYKCIVSIAGVADLNEMANFRSRFRGGWKAHVRETIADLEQEGTENALKSVSAQHHLNRIKAPILLIHGLNDTQVRASQSQDFYDEAKRKGLDVEYIEYKYGTHYLDENDNRKGAFKAIGEFLTQHL